MFKKIREQKASIHDVAIIGLSILVAIILIKAKVLEELLLGAKGLNFLGSFIAGIFFTSIFTTAPAIATLSEIASSYGVWQTAFSGTLGALLGDLLIFHFIKDKFSEHIKELLGHSNRHHRLKHLLKFKLFRVFSILLGGLIIASPLPDEIGISILGFSKIKSSYFILISFIFNFIGIALTSFILGVI